MLGVGDGQVRLLSVAQSKGMQVVELDVLVIPSMVVVLSLLVQFRPGTAVIVVRRHWEKS